MGDVMSAEEIFVRLSGVLESALNVEAEDITPAARLKADLGAESIDYLDIVFRLEREFGIRIPRDELFPEAIFAGDPAFVQNGLVTAVGLEELRGRLPFADLSGFVREPRVEAIGDLFTVGALARYLKGKLGACPLRNPG